MRLTDNPVPRQVNLRVDRLGIPAVLGFQNFSDIFGKTKRLLKVSKVSITLRGLFEIFPLSDTAVVVPPPDLSGVKEIVPGRIVPLGRGVLLVPILPTI